MIDPVLQDLEAKYPSGWVFGGAMLAVALLLGGLMTGNVMSYFDAVVIGMIGLLVMSSVGVRMARPVDASWLPGMIAAGFVAKMFFSLMRYLVLVELYGGSGDATGYHGSGKELVEYWRALQVAPGMDIGTGFVDGITGLLYVPYVPEMLGGFFIFATLAFVGQLFMYAALRMSVKPRRLKWYTYPLFFLPAITYWPASIGKESLMFLSIGLSMYGASIFLNRGGIRGLIPLGAGLAFGGMIRPHVSALIVACLAATLLFAKSKSGLGLSPVARWSAVAVVGAGSIFLVTFAAAQFNIDLQAASIGSEVDEFVANLEDNTSTGGSEVDGGAVTGPQDLPEAALRVLFRPLPYEAHNIAALASSLESAALLLIIVWRSPKILKNLVRIRQDPYVLMCAIMTLGFVVLFSPFLNLGLLARERSQILPFLAVLVIQLGWDFVKKSDEKSDEDTNTGNKAPVGVPA